MRRPSLRWLPTVALAALAGLVVLTVAILVRDPLPGEEPLLRTLHVGDRTWADRWQAVSGATATEWLALVAAAAAVVLAARRRAADAVLVVLAFGSAWLLVPVLKALVGRPRPDLWPLPGDVSAHGYPSGHATASAVLVGALLLAHRRAGTTRSRAVVAVAGLGAAGAVAASQLALGRHWPSDLVAGWLLALVCLAVSARLVRAR